MHLRTHASMKKLSVGSSRNTFSTLLLHYRVEVWGGSIPKSTLKELEHVQKHFLAKFLQGKKQMLHTLLLHATWSLTIEIMTMERVIEYMIKVQKSPSHEHPWIVWEASKNMQNIHKRKCLCSSWMQDMGYMVWKIRCTTLASWCMMGFLCKGGFFEMAKYHDIGKYGGSHCCGILRVRVGSVRGHLGLDPRSRR